MTSPKLAFIAAMLLTISVAVAQPTAPTSGTLTYETMRRMDLSNMRININGQEVRPGGTLPNGQPFNPPETREGQETVVFASNWAKREAMSTANRMVVMSGGSPDGAGGPPTSPSPEMARRMERMRNFRPPLEETQFTDLTTGKALTITKLRKDSVTSEYYRSDSEAKRPADWAVTGKTKKMLGYNCQLATCTIKEQPAKIWFTTELPYTFSPDARFTPDKGVVLWIESDDLMYRATKLTPGPVDAATLTPNPDAKVATPDELREIRRKAMATFRQQSGFQVRTRERE